MFDKFPGVKKSDIFYLFTSKKEGRTVAGEGERRAVVFPLPFPRQIDQKV